MATNVIDISKKNLHIAEVTSIVHFEKNFEANQRKLLIKMLGIDMIFLLWIALTIYLPFHALN